MNKLVVMLCAKEGQLSRTNRTKRGFAMEINTQKAPGLLFFFRTCCRKSFWPLLKGQIIWFNAEFLCLRGHAVWHREKAQCYWFPRVWFYSKRHKLTYSSCCIMEQSSESPRTVDPDTWLTALKQYTWPECWPDLYCRISKYIPNSFYHDPPGPPLLTRGTNSHRFNSTDVSGISTASCQERWFRKKHHCMITLEFFPQTNNNAKALLLDQAVRDWNLFL